MRRNGRKKEKNLQKGLKNVNGSLIMSRTHRKNGYKKYIKIYKGAYLYVIR